jgi:hypothetical protein
MAIEDWETHYTETGEAYYYNIRTDESTWYEIFLNSFSKRARKNHRRTRTQGQTSRVDDGARFGGTEW